MAKHIFKSRECVMCMYNILEDQSYCYCEKCNIHSHLSCLDKWNDKYSDYTPDTCCHCRQEGYLVKEIIPKMSCCGYSFFIRKKTNDNEK
jgi:hypothetical protein